MARMTYSTQTPFGQLISESINELFTATTKVHRSAEAISDMSTDQATAELGINAEEFTNFRNRLNDIKTTLEAEKFQSLLVLFDQG
ncbi:hypothetical protein [Endozoicomonas ascidiicola]|uniref:hypothetical protein n=1 Tax=Endozoicomonas ascidiicola TaxID=1698521 RepID=UPI000831BB24|nr:hypothetical protein [Endozoicomonas ascidiicola]